MSNTMVYSEIVKQKKNGIPELPSGGFNTGIVIKLKCKCPPDCPCGGQDTHNWYHITCDCQAYINQYGDIFCKNFKKPECNGYFIQHAQFQCNYTKLNGNTWQKFRTAAQFLMAIAQGLQAAEFQLDQHDTNTFTQSLNQTVIERWNK